MPMATLSLCCPGAALSEVECSAACTRRAPCLLVIGAAAARATECSAACTRRAPCLLVIRAAAARATFLGTPCLTARCLRTGYVCVTGGGRLRLWEVGRRPARPLRQL